MLFIFCSMQPRLWKNYYFWNVKCEPTLKLYCIKRLEWAAGQRIVEHSFMIKAKTTNMMASEDEVKKL